MISSPFQQKRATHNSNPSQQKKPNAKPYPSQQKGWHEANPFQSQIYAVFAAQFNYRI